VVARPCKIVGWSNSEQAARLRVSDAFFPVNADALNNLEGFCDIGAFEFQNPPPFAEHTRRTVRARLPALSQRRRLTDPFSGLINIGRTLPPPEVGPAFLLISPFKRRD